MKIYILILALLAGCAAQMSEYKADYVDARYSALYGWETVVGPVSLQCYRTTGAYVVHERAEVPCESQDGHRIHGCVQYDSRSIWIQDHLAEHQKADAAVHEFVHILALCEWSDRNSSHSSPILWIRAGGVNSIEAHGCANLSM